jgi:cobalamin synthase
VQAHVLVLTFQAFAIGVLDDLGVPAAATFASVLNKATWIKLAAAEAANEHGCKSFFNICVDENNSWNGPAWYAWLSRANFSCIQYA